MKRFFLFLMVFIPCTFYAQDTLYTASANNIFANKIVIQDNVERVIYDYTQSSELGLNKMIAPKGWTEPIIKAQFEIRGIVLEGVLGLEFEDAKQHIKAGDGFFIPKGTFVRIYNAGEEELILIEVLRPAYDPSLVKEYKGFPPE